MGQAITLIGIPASPLRLDDRYMLKNNPTAMKVYSFEMKEDGSPTPVKYLPRASSVMFTVFINERQLKSAGLDENSIANRKIMVQGELTRVVHLREGGCPGEFAVTTRQLKVVPEKAPKGEAKQGEKN